MVEYIAECALIYDLEENVRISPLLWSVYTILVQFLRFSRRYIASILLRTVEFATDIPIKMFAGKF